MHVPAPRLHTVRYYGHNASAARARRRELADQADSRDTELTEESATGSEDKANRRKLRRQGPRSYGGFMRPIPCCAPAENHDHRLLRARQVRDPKDPPPPGTPRTVGQGTSPHRPPRSAPNSTGRVNSRSHLFTEIAGLLASERTRCALTLDLNGPVPRNGLDPGSSWFPTPLPSRP